MLTASGSGDQKETPLRGRQLFSSLQPKPMEQTYISSVDESRDFYVFNNVVVKVFYTSLLPAAKGLVMQMRKIGCLSYQDLMCKDSADALSPI